MAKPNYSFAKRQREIAKKEKKEAKRKQKAEAQQQLAQDEVTEDGSTPENLPQDDASQQPVD